MCNLKMLVQHGASRFITVLQLQSSVAVVQQLTTLCCTPLCCSGVELIHKGLNRWMDAQRLATG